MLLRLEPSMTLGLPDSAREFINSVKAKGSKLDVTIEEHREDRTADQNALFHLLVRRISEQSGADFEDTKAMVKSRAVGMGYPYWVIEGEPQHDEKGDCLPKPSSEANVKDFSILIDTCYIVADEFGYDLGDRRV